MLEGDGSRGLALPLHLHMFLSLYRLMQTVRIPPSGHDAPGELVHDQHLIVLHHIVLIPEHQIMSPQGQYDIMLYLQILRVGIILDVKELLHLLYARLREIDDLVLFVDDEVPCLLLHHAHDGIHLGQLLHVLSPMHTSGQKIAHLIEGCGLAALARYDQRRSGLVDQHRVHLVDDAIVEIPQHQLLLVKHHIVPEIIKTQLIAGHISNIAGIGVPALLGGHTV